MPEYAERPKRPIHEPAKKPARSVHEADVRCPVEPPVSRRLEFDHPWLRLPLTRIGELLTAKVDVRNPDSEPRSLDPAAPLLDDPFGDFTITQATTRVLDPGATVPLDVEFRPSRAGELEQTFQVSTDRGFGPTGELRVSGTGVEHDGSSTEQRLGEQKTQRHEIEAVRTSDRLHGQRDRANESIREWAKSARDINASYADWMQANTLDFLGRLGGDVHFDPPSWKHIVVTKLLAKLTTKLIVPELESAPAAGKVVEKSVEKVAEFIWDRVSNTPRPDPDAAAVDATARMARDAIADEEAITGARNEANRMIDDTESTAYLRIATASSASELAGWQRWVAAQHGTPLPRKADRTLADELLVEWVLQRARTTTECGADTNSTAWNNARAHLSANGRLRGLERTDLFIHQCRNEWSRLRLANDAIEAAVSSLDRDRRRLEQRLVSEGLAPAQIATSIATDLGSNTYGHQTIEAWFHLSRECNSTAAQFAKEDVGLQDPNKAHDVFGKRFDLTCSLVLSGERAAVHVDAFVYHLDSDGYSSDFRRTP